MANRLTYKRFSMILAILLVATLMAMPCPVSASESYCLHGAYFETGYQDPLGINCTFFREGESSASFELDGEYTVTATVQGTVFKFNLGYNMSRTYYVFGNETVYVIKPSEPYYTYYFEVDDFVGIQWGYLESLININGTDRVVERWDVKNFKGEVPFIFTWGNAYKMRLVCNKGSYVYGSYVAGGSNSYTLGITIDMFPQVPVDRAFAIGAQRLNGTTVYAYYSDVKLETNWVQFQIYENEEATPIYTYNTTANPTATLLWNEAAWDVDYYCKITLNHEVFGTLIYSYACSRLEPPSTNPFTGFRLLGTFPFDLAQLPAVTIIVCVFGIFSWASAPIGIIFSALTAVLLKYINWFDVSWSWLGIAVPLAFLIAIIMWKERQPDQT